MLCDHWSLFVINNISENTYFTTLYIFTILFYISYSILYICIKLKVDCIDPHLKHVPNLITSHNKSYVDHLKWVLS